MPFVFAYSPAMLIMVDGFTWADFFITTSTCALGVLLLGIGTTGYAFTHMGFGAKAWLVLAALLMISPNIQMTVVGAALALPVILWNWRKSTRIVQTT